MSAANARIDPVLALEHLAVDADEVVYVVGGAAAADLHVHVAQASRTATIHLCPSRSTRACSPSSRSASRSTCAPFASRAGAASRSTNFQQAAFYGGVALWAVALLSPVDSLAEDLLSLHMTQHLLLAELGGPLILVGLRAPVIFFFLPRPAMVALARRRRCAG